MTPGPYPTNDPFGGKPQKELFDIEQSSKVEGRDRARLQYEQHVSKKRGGAGLSGSKWETPSPSTTPIESSKRHAGASSSTRASSAASLDTLPAGKQPKLGAVRQASAPVSSPTRDDHPKKQVNQQLFQQPNLSDNPANVAGPNVVRPISPSKNPRPPIKASSPSSAQPAKPSGAFEELRPYLNHEWGSSSGSSSKSPLLPRMQNNSPSSTLSQAERPVPTSPDFISKPFEQLSIATSQNGQSSLRQASQMSGASPDNSQKSGTDDISSYDESSDSSDYSADGPVTPPTRKMLVPKTRYKNGLSSPLQALSKGNVAPLSMENHKPSQASKDQNPVYGSKPLSHDSKTVKPLASMNINAPKSSMAESKYAPKGPEAGESTAGPRMPSFESYQDKLVELDIAKNKPAVVPSQSGPKAMLSTSMAESKFSVVTTPASRAAVPTQQMSSKDSNTSKAPRDSPFGLAGDVGKKLAKYDWKQNDAKENHTSTTAPMSPKASVLQTMPNSRSLSISDAPPSPFGNISGTQDKLAKYDWKQTPVKEEKKSATVPPAPKAAQIQSSSGVRLTSSTTSDRPNKDNSEPQSFSQSKSKHEATSQDGQASKGLASTVIPARMGADTRTASKGPAAALGVPRVLPRQAATASTRSVSTPLARAPASLLTAKASKANMKANIAAACSTLSSIANEGLSDEEGEVVGGWGQGDAPVRRGPNLHVRRVVITGFDDQCHARNVQAVVWGGALEKIIYEDRSKTAEVIFVLPQRARQYWEESADKIRWSNLTFTTSLSDIVDPPHPHLQEWEQMRASRCITAVKPSAWTFPMCQILGRGGKKDNVRGMESCKVGVVDCDGGNWTPCVRWRFESIIEAVRLYRELKADIEWRYMPIEFSVDPCKTASGIHEVF